MWKFICLRLKRRYRSFYPDESENLSVQAAGTGHEWILLREEGKGF